MEKNRKFVNILVKRQVYEELKSLKGENESFGDVITRLIKTLRNYEEKIKFYEEENRTLQALINEVENLKKIIYKYLVSPFSRQYIPKSKTIEVVDEILRLTKHRCPLCKSDMKIQYAFVANRNLSLLVLICDRPNHYHDEAVVYEIPKIVRVNDETIEMLKSKGIKIYDDIRRLDNIIKKRTGSRLYALARKKVPIR